MAAPAAIPPPLSQGVGYGIVVGVGAVFAVGMSLTSWMLSRYMHEIQDSEMFMTAKHTVKTGLTASAVVSSWTIATTLLTSTTYGYTYGVSGPFWYAAGACVQIMLFSVAAVELKRKAPNAQTFLQVVKVRYGVLAHIVFTAYSLIYQIITTVNLLVGGSAIYAAITGVNRDAICFLFPIGVVIYTLMGGIKATFITDWVHTVIIYVIMLTALFVLYAVSDAAGSPGRVWELLREAAALHPVEGNAGGQYLTMRSVQGGYVGLVFIGAGFAACVDSQLFQKAIASDPRSTSTGYIIGGLAWFTIPFVLASTFGLAAAALEHLPVFPTYPRRMTAEEASIGLAMPYAAMALMGKGGAVAVLLMVFMAVTSAMSSETVATTALVTYNIYGAYFKPQATGRQLLFFSHFITVSFAIFCSAIAVAFNHGGFSVGFLITAIGILVDGAIVPMACTIMWRKQSRWAAILVPIFSSTAGLLAWFMTAYTHTPGHVISIDSLSGNLPLVAGNVMSLTAPLVLTPVLTLLTGPENFDWRVFKTAIHRGDDAVATEEEADDSAEVVADEADEANDHHHGNNEALLLKARNRSAYLSVFLTISLVILWPIPMYASSYVFSRRFFTGWAVVLFLWAFWAALTVTLLPIWEGRTAIKVLFAHISKGEKSNTVVVVHSQEGESVSEGEAGKTVPEKKE